MRHIQLIVHLDNMEFIELIKMRDKRKIILGSKDVFPFKNNDLFLNVELSRTSNELINEIVDNNFDILEQFENERQNSLKF